MARTQGKGVLLAAVACALMAVGSARASDTGAGRVWLEAHSQEVHQQRSTLSQVARAAMPAVVSITTKQVSTDSSQAQNGIGSGFIIHPDGYVLTSAHVVEGASQVTISLDTRGYREDFPARIIGQDERTDCALLKIDTGRKLPALKLSSASRVEVADWIVVIGNPFGLSRSVTVGVVSYKGRDDVTPNGRKGDFDYLQMDASINPGNSGGPVLDLHGDVVAIANAVNVAGQGIGFAVPIDIAKSVLPHLKAYGHVRRGWLGIDVQDYSPSLGAKVGLSHPARGVVITEVAESGPGERAGLRRGDVIVSMDAERVERAHQMRWQVAALGVGRTVVLHVRRGAQPLKMRVKLVEPPPEEPVAPTVAARSSPARQPASSHLDPVLTEQDWAQPVPSSEPLLAPDADPAP